MENKHNTQKMSRLLGILYLSLAVIAPFSMLYINAKVIVPHDLIATLTSISSNSFLFRVGITADTLVFLIELIIVVLIYQLFKSVNATFALAATFSRLAMLIIQASNIIWHLVAIDIATNPNYLATITRSEQAFLTDLALNINRFGVDVWQLFFGLHLIILGILAFKSGYVPKSLGILVIAASAGYLVQSYTHTLMPSSHFLITLANILLVVSTIGEVAFTLWLIVKGLNKEATVR